jgi:prevent-host-death family protein
MIKEQLPSMMLNQVQCRNDSIVVNKHGKPVAALVSAELFARIRSMRDRFDALSERIAEASAEVPVEEGLAEMDTLVAQIRHTRFKKTAIQYPPESGRG